MNTLATIMREQCGSEKINQSYKRGPVSLSAKELHGFVEFVIRMDCAAKNTDIHSASYSRRRRNASWSPLSHQMTSNGRKVALRAAGRIAHAPILIGL